MILRSFSAGVALATAAVGVYAQAPVVNAPVAPEALYVGCGGPSPGLRIIDLNGFGQGTGDLATTRFPLNPNLGRPGVVPPLAVGSSSLDAGGAGAMTLTRDSAGNDLLLPLGSVRDLAIGQPLDLVFNNDNINPNAGSANQVNPAVFQVQAGNTIMVAPHPNPPRLVFPPPNPARGIEAEEPTVTSSIGPPGMLTTTVPPCLPIPLNQLVPGNPFSSDPSQVGLFGANFAGVFYGPQPAPPQPPPPPAFCPYSSRQQVGHFLYALDAAKHEVVVINSNRCTVLARIAVPDGTSMAMAPNLALLAVSNASHGSVTFIDTEPRSATFHQVVATTKVGSGARGLAWQPEGEDLLVCNERANSVSIISAVDLQVRHTVDFAIRAPRDVVVSFRQTTEGFQTGTYFAYVLNGNGTVAVIESGPTSIGLDDTTAVVGPFRAASAIAIDGVNFGGGCWVAHRDLAGLGQVSHIELTSSPVGPFSVVINDHEKSRRRQRTWSITQRIGGLNTPDLLSGNDPVDLAFDDIQNQGAYPDVRSPIVSGLGYALHSGKGLLKHGPIGIVRAQRPMFLAVALADVGKVDLFEIATGRRVQTVAAQGVSTVAGYWRQ